MSTDSISKLVEGISPNAITSFFKDKNSSFRAKREPLEVAMRTEFTQLQKLGEINYRDTAENLLIFSCRYSGTLNERSAKKEQFDIAKRVLQDDFKDGAVFVFYDDKGTFRFSFIRRNYGDDKQKFTPWRRYTYLVEPEAKTNKTFRKRVGDCDFSSLDSIQEAFSVTYVSDKFFEEYKTIYGELCGYITGKYFEKKGTKWVEAVYPNSEPELKQFYQQFNGNEKLVRDYIKKLLGRLVFLKFIEKKRWLGCSKNSPDWNGGDTNFLQNLFENSSLKDDFLDKVLEAVLFDSLNSPHNNTDCKELEQYKFPYLNGGLFERDELDSKAVKIPAHYFQKIFDFFNRYNFTIDENDPNDTEVGVDPEMLGRIFENLLEDNKDKGAFYTPKEIVQYMCQESLIQYLTTHLGEHAEIADFVKLNHIDRDNRNSFIVKHAKQIEELLDSVKICDPAVGSGAFPMGLLQEIFRAKMALDLTLQPEEVKEHIIQNSIYGVDIEKGAVDIARLRFWLSLVVDSDTPKPLPNLDYKIMCGNSLISRYAIDIPIDRIFDEYNKNKKKKGDEKFTLEKYKRLVADYTDKHEGKERFRQQIREIKKAFTEGFNKHEVEKRQKLEGEIVQLESNTLFGTASKEHLAKAKEKKKELAQILQAEQDAEQGRIYENAFEWRFEFPALLDDKGDFTGFDIVIGNPPYGADIDNSLSILKRKFPVVSEGYVDIYKYFFNQGVYLIRSNGVLCYITPNTFLRQPRYGDVRRLLLNYRLRKIIDLGEDIFEAVVPTAISVVLKKTSSEVLFADLNKCEDVKSALEEVVFSIIQQSHFSQTSNNIFTANHRKIQENEYLLSEIIDMKDAGINYQRVNVGLKDKGNSDLSKRLLYEGEQESVADVEYWKGVDIGAFYISEKTNRYARRNIETLPNERVILNATYFGVCPKLLWRQTAQYPIVAVDRKGIWFGRSIQAGIIKEQFRKIVSYEFLCALLNSTYLRYLYDCNVKENGRVFPQVKLEKIKPLPIIIVDNQQPFIEKVNAVIDLKKQNPDNPKVKELEEEINQLVYKLYGLTEDEINIVEGK